MKEGTTGGADPEAANEAVPVTRGVIMDWQAPFYDWGCRAIGLGRNFRDETLRHAVLKPGGRFVVVDINRPANPLWWLVI